MKKRKSPIFLVAVIIVIFGVVAAMNANLLSEPQTPEQLAAQQQQQAKDAQKQQPAKPAPPATKKPNPAAKPDDKSFVSPTVEKNDAGMPGTNVKPVPAVDPNGPKIAAPRNLTGRDKAPDRANPQASGQWYTKDSYASSTGK
jgi:hypothetical protein